MLRKQFEMWFLSTVVILHGLTSFYMTIRKCMSYKPRKNGEVEKACVQKALEFVTGRYKIDKKIVTVRL